MELASVSTDGRVLVWDLRKLGLRRHVPLTALPLPPISRCVLACLPSYNSTPWPDLSSVFLYRRTCRLPQRASHLSFGANVLSETLALLSPLPYSLLCDAGDSPFDTINLLNKLDGSLLGGISLDFDAALGVPPPPSLSFSPPSPVPRPHLPDTRGVRFPFGYCLIARTPMWSPFRGGRALFRSSVFPLLFFFVGFLVCTLCLFLLYSPSPPPSPPCLPPSAQPSKFMVGTEQGIALQCNRKAKTDPDKVSAPFGGHFGPVYSIQRNPFHSRYFLTISDWCARVCAAQHCRGNGGEGGARAHRQRLPRIVGVASLLLAKLCSDLTMRSRALLASHAVLLLVLLLRTAMVGRGAHAHDPDALRGLLSDVRLLEPNQAMSAMHPQVFQTTQLRFSSQLQVSWGV